MRPRSDPRLECRVDGQANLSKGQTSPKQCTIHTVPSRPPNAPTPTHLKGEGETGEASMDQTWPRACEPSLFPIWI